MQYTVKQLAGLSGLTPRTLRYYDAFGLLRPGRDRENDYRLYGSAEVDRLQQILLYREMGLPLEVIGNLLDTPGFDRAAALREHLRQLQNQRRRLDTLIGTVRRTLSMIEGGDNMSDQAALLRAMAAGDPAGADAREACRLHRDWLLHYWTPEMMTEEAHTGLVEAYSRDERFAAYYEKIAPGCADFFAQAIRAYYRKE